MRENTAQVLKNAALRNATQLLPPLVDKGPMVIRPPFCQPSAHATISPDIYRRAAYDVVAQWLAKATQMPTWRQARRDLARLSMATLNIDEPTLNKQARLWHQRLPIRPPLRQELATELRRFFFSVEADEELLEAISGSERAMSVFDPNEIEMRAETIAAQDFDIRLRLAGLFG